MAIKNIGEVSVKLTADTKAYRKSLDKARKTTKSFTTKAADAFRKMKGPAIALTAIGVAAGAMGTAVSNALAKLDKIGKSAKNIGVTAETFQELQHAANLSGVGVDLFQKSMAKLEKASEDAKDGLVTMSRAFDKMGISVKDLDNLSPEELLDKVSDGISGIEDPIQQAAIAMQIFGGKGLDMLELLKNGSAGLADMRAEARELGIVLSNELIAAAEKNNDKLSTMKSIVSAQWVQVWAELAPATIAVSKAFASMARSAADFLTTDIDEKIEDVTEQIMTANTQLQHMFESKQAQIAIDGQIRKLQDLGAELNKLNKQKKDLDKEPDKPAVKINADDLKEKVKKVGKKNALDEIISPVEKQRMEQLKKNEEERVRLAEEANVEIGDSTIDLYGVMLDASNQWLDASTDAMADFVLDGKADFASLANSIIRDLVRIQAKQALMSLFGGSAGGGAGGILGTLIQGGAATASAFAGTKFNTGFGTQQSRMLAAQQFASGGRHQAGKPMIVGERGPELVIPDTAGRVIPQIPSAKSSQSKVSVQVTNTGAAKDAQVTQKQQGDSLIISVLLDDMEQGGTFTQNLQNTFGIRRT